MLIPVGEVIEALGANRTLEFAFVFVDLDMPEKIDVGRHAFAANVAPVWLFLICGVHFDDVLLHSEFALEKLSTIIAFEGLTDFVHDFDVSLQLRKVVEDFPTMLARCITHSFMLSFDMSVETTNLRVSRSTNVTNILVHDVWPRHTHLGPHWFRVFFVDVMLHCCLILEDLETKTATVLHNAVMEVVNVLKMFPPCLKDERTLRIGARPVVIGTHFECMMCSPFVEVLVSMGIETE